MEEIRPSAPEPECAASEAQDRGLDVSHKLTKAQLALDIVTNCGFSQRESKRVLELILDAMVQALSRGERIEIRGFGTMATRIRKARVRRNPATGEKVEVPAKRVPYFRASKQLKEML